MAYLNGIDISSYQAGINLTVVPCDFVIVKATQGTGYVNPDCSRAVEQARGAGKLFGTYHYISGGDPVAEANYYIDNITNWIGKGMLCLDWESNQNRAWGNEAYLERMVERIIDRTHIPPVIYVQASRYAQTAAVAKRHNCGLWIAQYASMSTTGYQATPWNEGAYACAIRQYSSAGRLNGWGGALDLNKFYGDRSTWMAYVTGGKGGAVPSPEPVKPVSLVVDGSAGPATIRRWQQVMGTTVDGVISGQLVPKGYARPALKSVTYGGGGSQLIRAVQRKLNLTQDGLLGPATIRAIQQHLGVAVDASFGPATVRALQTRLNNNTF